MKYRYISLTLLAAFSATGGKADVPQAVQSAPKLVVNIAIDQLRTDYLEAFAPLYGTEGFRLLLTKGKVYENASYPFSPIDRASAIAAIASGTTPYYNSIVGTQWLDKETLRPVFCVDDSKYGGYLTQDCSSPKNLLTSTIGDELKVATGGAAIVYAVAPFRDAAVLSAGHAADGALWIDDDNGYWCSSNYYFKSNPSWIQAFNNLHAGDIEESQWTPANQLSGNFSYFMGGGAQKPFKHTFDSDRRYREFKASGLVNASVTDMALQCVATNAMGTDNVTDLLNITYYAGNFDHKAVTECQMEIQDTYVRLDREIARLVKELERKVGAQHVLFVITSTGYYDEENADYAKYNIPTGTYYVNLTANLLNMYFGALWGPAQYVETCFGTQIFLDHKQLEQKRINVSKATERAQEFLTQISGVRNVYTSQQLLSSGNQHIYKIRNGYNPERNGDILIEVAPGWQVLNETNLKSHLSRASFTQFPIIIYGAGTKAERLPDHVTTDRIAPTISKAIRIRAPNACSAEPLF